MFLNNEKALRLVYPSAQAIGVLADVLSVSKTQQKAAFEIKNSDAMYLPVKKLRQARDLRFIPVMTTFEYKVFVLIFYCFYFNSFIDVCSGRQTCIIENQKFLMQYSGKKESKKFKASFIDK